MKLKDQMGSWYEFLLPLLQSEYFKKLGAFLVEENTKHPITPTFDNTFRAFKECPRSELKVVLLGQDPYPGTFPATHVADGLAFSTRNTPLSEMPASLENILRAIEQDCYGGLNMNIYCMKDLTHWANQGVLMLNTALSTRLGKKGCHTEMWKSFITYVLKELNKESGLIYVFLGKQPQSFIPLIDESKNFIMAAEHPATSAYKGSDAEWAHNRIFSRINAILEKTNNTRISWEETVTA